MESKKTIEEKIAEKFINERYVYDIIRECNDKYETRILGLQDILKIGDKIYNKIMKENTDQVGEIVGQRPLELKKLRKEIIHLVKPHLEEYIKYKNNAKLMI